MIFDTGDPAQKEAFTAAVMTQELLYGNAFLLRASGGRILLLEAWPNPSRKGA